MLSLQSTQFWVKSSLFKLLTSKLSLITERNIQLQFHEQIFNRKTLNKQIHIEHIRKQKTKRNL